MQSEAEVERVLRVRLTDYGFQVLKLYTPGTTGAMDRMILRPRYSPGPPMFVELKRGRKGLRALQAARAADWSKRGCVVLPYCSGLNDVEQLCETLIQLIMPDYRLAKLEDL